VPEDVARAVRVALVNDYEVVVKGLREMLADFAEHVQVVEVDLGVEVEQRVDVALYDCFAAPPLHTEDLADLVTQSRVGAVAVYTWSTRTDLVDQALETGARGWLSKSLDAASIVSALRRLAAGEQVVLLGDVAAGGDVDCEQTGGDWPGRAAGLTPRQAEILCLIARGLSNKEICERTYLTLNTVKSYIREAYRTIGVATRVQAVLWGVEHGLVPTPGRRTELGPDPD
jgi:DNA-binding NarL/FixJ family response regulator